MINENNVSIIIFLLSLTFLSYFAGHKDGQNDNYFYMFVNCLVGACDISI